MPLQGKENTVVLIGDGISVCGVIDGAQIAALDSVGLVE